VQGNEIKIDKFAIAAVDRFISVHAIFHAYSQITSSAFLSVLEDCSLVVDHFRPPTSQPAQSLPFSHRERIENSVARIMSVHFAGCRRVRFTPESKHWLVEF